MGWGDNCSTMEEAGEEILREKEIVTQAGTYSLVLSGRDLGSAYPGMILYTLLVLSGDTVIARFRTNTFEYPPSSAITARTAAIARADEWEHDLATGHPEFLAPQDIPVLAGHPGTHPDVLILQGSPRAQGNSSILAAWAHDQVIREGSSSAVVYLDDLIIRGCIGCYQCYNTGTCTFEDDMTGLIGLVRGARLIIVCTPVYTNTVPGVLKIFFDRCQAYHAEQVITGAVPQGKRGLLFAVAGRQGEENFSCVTSVVHAFMRHLRIRPSGSVLFDDLDRTKDIRQVPGAEDRIRSAVKGALLKGEGQKERSVP